MQQHTPSPHPLRLVVGGHALPYRLDEPVLTTSQPNVHSSSDRLASRNPPAMMSHTRDPSAARGRATDSSPGSIQSLQPQPQPRLRTQSHSKSPESVGTRSATSLDGEGLERRPSNSAYGHHRQASIVHGSIQHSRNASFAASSANPGPLSPEGIATAAYGVSHALDSPLNGKRDPQEYSSGYTGAGTPATGHMQPATLTTIQDNHQAEIASEPSSQRKATTSGKSRRDHSHHPSHSSKHSQEARTVGEYALHHLFNSAKQTPPFVAALSRRNTEPTQPGPENPDSSTMPNNSLLSPVSRQEDVVLAERRATVSVYLVCRVLIEIFNQSTLQAITAEMAERLEDIVFGQLKTVDPDQIAASPLRMANWRIYGQLLGIMSESNFGSVSNRFLAELSQFQKDDFRLASTKDAETKAELLVFGMRHLQIRTSPEDAWSRSCDFLLSVARLFVNSHGQSLKQAYCQILESFLLPIAANLSCDLTSPKWRELVDLLVPRLSQILPKPRHWNSAFPLYILLLCASPKEAFYSQWMSVITSLPQKLKDRPSRGTALQAICRLLWTYLFRYPDPHSNPLRKIDEITRIALPGGRRTYLTTETAVAEPLTQLVRMVGYKHPDMCFRGVIFPLVNSDLIMSGKELKIEQMEPEKMVIGIRSFLAIMADLDHGGQEPPPFPQDFAVMDQPFATSFPFADPRVPLDHLNPNKNVLHETVFRPVNTAKLSENSRKFYYRFCEILGKITILCDNTFGGQAALDEKFGGVTPKTPITEAFSFGRRDDHSNGPDQKQAFYDLLHVAVQALPRCLCDHIPFNSLINLLCTGTAHVQSNIATSSAESLKSIARLSHAQHVAIGFARFIFNFDARYSTMSDEGMLGPGHIESTLKLYVELIQIWIGEIRQKSRDATSEPSENGGSGSRGLQLDLSAVMAHVEEIESHGLFFLCSQSRRVRAFAITVLRLVTEFDSALGKTGKDVPRIIQILEDASYNVLDLKDELLTVAERSRLQKGKQQNGPQNTLIEICSSEVSYDSTLWSKVFPNLIRISFRTCPFAVTLGREIVCARLVQMHNSIAALAENFQPGQYGSLDIAHGRPVPRSSNSPDILVEQWKLYLIMACTTINTAGAQSQSQLANAQHARKTSKAGQHPQDKIGSARALFATVIPLLSAGPDSIRNAIVVALGSINKNLYRTLLESLQYAVTTCNEEARVRIGTHNRTPSSPRRNRRTDRLRTEVTNVYKVTSHFLKEPEVYNDDWILNNLVTYTKDLRIFLSDVEVQNDLEFQRLRFHYCGLLEELFEGINKSKDPSRWMPFESRKSAFSLMEDWCGYSPNQSQLAAREENMRKLVIARQREAWEARSTAALEIEKRNLRTAALSAMASLCGGPIKITTESKATLQFDMRRMLSWIDIILNTVSDKLHAIGRRALKNLIVHNKDLPYLLEQSIEMCYISESPKALESYFDVVAQVLMEHIDYPFAFWRILGAVLFALGNAKREIRMKSARLLRTLEERQQKSSRIQDFDISISDKTTAVYKLAQFETSKRLAQQHADLAFTIFSEFSLHFKKIQPDTQRNMVAAILPWIQAIELQVDPNGGPTAKSYMLLANLFEITIQSGNVLPNEVQALWQALATGPHAGNVQLVLDFIIQLCLERKEQNFVDYAKQIIVFLSTTLAGSKVIEFFLMQVIPKNMVQERRDPLPPPSDLKSLPYVADLGTVLPVGNKQILQAGFSLGQVSLIFLVDLMVSPVTLGLDNVIKLLHTALIFWDHYTLTVQEQAREMLVHLIHELVASKIGDSPDGMRTSIEDFVECIRRGDTAVVWDYEDNNGGEDDQDPSRVPASMHRVTQDVANFFSTAYESVNDIWAKEALNWATSCPVRHLACRSFQVFRCISTSLDSRMLADMLARLSNTIADEETDYQTFSMEILTTLKIIINSLAPQDLLRYPQLFWTTCACLNTIHEREFMESVGMLEKYLDKVDMRDPAVLTKLRESKPPKWEGDFEGIQVLIYKGLKSGESLDKTLSVLHRLTALPNDELVGDNNRLLFAILANLPILLHQFHLPERPKEVVERARLLASISENNGYTRFSDCLFGFSSGHYKLSQDFLVDSVEAIRSYYFPEQEAQTLIFLIGLLTNTTAWFRIMTMKILCAIISEIDMRRPEVACYGPDLISPLLRLLHTDLCPQALEVMDHIMTVSGNPMERHHLRMSMASACSSRAIRKEFERIQSLYGIPERTGWSIPVPAAQSALTRNNVHAVFYTCAEADGSEQTPASPEMEFHVEEYNNLYSPGLRADTMKSFDTQNDGNMGDLLQKLDSLDDFFDETEAIPRPLNSISGTTLHSFVSDFHDASANLYDQQTAPLLRKSLARTASSSSFQNGLAESRPTTSRTEASGMHSSPLGVSSSLPPSRTSMHTRSVTSPANAYPSSSQSSMPMFGSSSAIPFLSDDELEEALSDSDDRLVLGQPASNSTTSPRHGNEGPFSLESVIRSSVRRLTGGTSSSREKERQRDLLRAQQRAFVHTTSSPRVPRVPQEYLTGPSGGLQGAAASGSSTTGAASSGPTSPGH
ncbi:transcriptional activator leucine zipper [Histoplasma capsulatum var. duboisii H88]|uniref:Transcriptional activator leucine zipper n=3 Tax=Ajellomyces capsulatus TaxID=5037 RepID=F0UP67_AJEC8|nr:transcriptional activator leucine zipper [Histoplasma capsulatum var. duboisii H88]